MNKMNDYLVIPSKKIQQDYSFLPNARSSRLCSIPSRYLDTSSIIGCHALPGGSFLTKDYTVGYCLFPLFICGRPSFPH
jgi:hypothetical protein